jgi:hypothetical protein
VLVSERGNVYAMNWRQYEDPARGHFLLGMILLLAACAAVAPTQPQRSTPNLGGTSWQLVKFQGSDDKTLTPDDETK